MSNDLLKLAPEAVFRHFDAITKIPHPSSHEEKIAEYIINFAKEHSLQYVKDAVGNVIVYKEASLDKKDAPPVILQGHMDMVPMATTGYNFNFLTDSIETYIENGFIHAKNTTLGADDGIAIAIILALFEDTSLTCGPLCAIFTVEEETTMKGAANLEAKYLKGKYLINIDSEEDGFLYVNCAGSLDCNITLPLQNTNKEFDSALKLSLLGLHGGHSGADIHIGFANAIKVMTSLCQHTLIDSSFELSLRDFNSGTLRNAIPSSATLSINIHKKDETAIIDNLKKQWTRQQALYQDTDADMQLHIEPCDEENVENHKGYSKESFANLLNLIYALPSGVLRMSKRFEGIVESSNNVSIISLDAQGAQLKLMPRSLNYEWLLEQKTMLSQIATAFNSQVAFANLHEPWESPCDNHLIDVLKQSYKEVCHKEFVISAMHGGVECAAFAKLNKNLELISLGPTIFNPHSPAERVHIEGVKELYLTLRRTLAML